MSRTQLWLNQLAKEIVEDYLILNGIEHNIKPKHRNVYILDISDDEKLPSIPGIWVVDP